MIGSINYLISFYISIWYTLNLVPAEKIPKPKYTLERKYSNFIRYDRNVIESPYPGNTLLHFYRKTESLINREQEKLSIVHIGDSHIQADYFSNQIRQHFNDETLLGNGGRGYVFPCSMAASHNPYTLAASYTGRWSGCQNIQASRTCSWGLGGMTASTRDSTATFTVDPNSRTQHKYPITRVKVYYDVQDVRSYSVKLVTPQGLVLPQRINALGYAEFFLPEPTEKVTFRLYREYLNQNTFTLQGISFENDNPGVQYHSVGVNSATVSSFLRSPKLENHLTSLNPDLIIVSLGTNDAYTLRFDANKYKLNMAMLLQRIKHAVPYASIILTTPGDCALRNGRSNPSNLAARSKIYELAEEANCAVWDLFNIMGGKGSVHKWFAQKMTARDRVHFSKKGYQLQGDLLYDALILDYANYRLSR